MSNYWNLTKIEGQEESLSFDELLTELVMDESVALAGGSLLISTQISHFVGDIPVKKIVANRTSSFLSNGLLCNTPEKYEPMNYEFEKVEDFDLCSSVQGDLLRCDCCGGFPKMNYWKMKTYTDDDCEENCFCSGLCIQRYIRSYNYLNSKVPDELPEKIILDYVTPKAIFEDEDSEGRDYEKNEDSELLSVGWTIQEAGKNSEWEYKELRDEKGKIKTDLSEIIAKEYPTCFDSSALHRLILVKKESESHNEQI
ncbi:MAG: hypothetical protein MJ133_06925 [Lachnospiraceae bacterium]|nr:hypothetical protein [Lachnospiraceae bacterium]